MSLMPEGWSVDTDGSNIILKIPSGAGNYVLSAAEARALKNRLHIAYLIASRRELGAAGPEDSRQSGKSGGQQAADRGTDRDVLSRFFAGPTDEDRARLRSDLLSRVALVRTNGWEPYRGVWSTGELIGVAALLGADGELAALGETLQTAWSRWAFDLWGLNGGQADVDNGCQATRQWFEGAANEVNQ
jgi:hypothetical protein